MTGLEALKVVERDCEDLEQVPYGEFAIIERFLKALEIIKEKNVNIGLVKVLCSVEQYNQTYVYDNMLNVKWCLTEEEFNLLIEVLE